MLAVWSWLKELAELSRDIDPDEAAAVLTGAGLEVEGFDNIGDDFSGVVVAEVAAKKKHPNADKLTVVDVIDTAGGTSTEVICGAPNVPEPGGRVLWARPGAVLPGGFEIGKKALKGVESAGMLCSEKELSLGDDHDGIIVLCGVDAAAELGADVRSALCLSDVVFDIGVPANRPDTLGHLGIARELVALVGGTLRPPNFDLADITDDSLDAAALVEVSIDDPAGCPRYVARIVDGVTNTTSPMWLQQRLRGVGVRPISNLVDVTNYVMFELGQPLHAFDHGRVRGARIDVRRARDGETITTLDDIERSLVADDILICDGGGPVALGGVMGGLESEVAKDTSRVLLEAANFLPTAIRRTARRLGLHSESSHRFERHVDPNGCDRASARAARLLAELGGGRVARGAVDAYVQRAEARKVSMRASRATALTGIDISRDRAKQLLSRLELEVAEAPNPDVLEVTSPTFRADLSREVDLIEEVVRLHGFEKVPTTLPSLSSSPSRRTDRRPVAARRALVAAGLSEAITYGFTSPDRIAALGLPDSDPRARPVKLENPMSLDQSVMRTSLVPNLLAAIGRNISFGVRDARLFEIGSVFVQRDAAAELPEEPVHIAGVITGSRAGWLGERDELTFYDIKGAVESTLFSLGVADPRFSSTDSVPYLHPGVCARVSVGDLDVGVLGEVHPQTRRAFEIEPVCFAFDLSLEALPPLDNSQMVPIPRYPAIVRDISFFVSEDMPAMRVFDEIHSADEPLIETVRVLEEYKEAGKVPEGQKGMLWSITYRSLYKTLTDSEVDAAHEVLVRRLLGSLSATRR